MESMGENLVSMFSLLLCLFLNFLAPCAGGDTFTSSANLMQLLQSEESVLWNIEDYVRREEGRLADIKRLIEQRREVRRKDEIYMQDAAKYVGHPLNAYRLIEQLYSISSKVTDKRNEDDLRRRLILDARPFPEEGDYKGALGALLRLQRVYNITTEEMRAGSMYGQPAAEPLHASDAMSLGVAARHTGDYGLSAKWLDIAMESRYDPVVSWSDAAMESAETHYMIGDFERAMEILDEVKDKDPNNQTLQVRYNTYKRQNDTNYRTFKITADTWRRILPDWKTNYEALCRGDQVRNDPAYQSTLFCQYRPSFIPYAPTKEELLSVDPRVSLLYDVISDREADAIKSMATPMLYRAVVGDPSKAYATDERVSKVGWLWDSDQDPLINHLSKRISYITGLETEYRASFSSAEPFQVVNYGMGGQYEPHVDFYELSQPEAGGATVFPKIKVRVPAVKNAAAFWYNIKKSGEKDQRTQHAGCPVLLGEKWVANKWIREYGQEFRRPCGMTYDESDDITS